MWYYEGRIRIEPDWNVKLQSIPHKPDFSKIRIEPDWNVKSGIYATMAELELN